MSVILLVRLDRVEMRASSIIVAFKPDVILKSVLGRHAHARMTYPPPPKHKHFATITITSERQRVDKRALTNVVMKYFRPQITVVEVSREPQI